MKIPEPILAQLAEAIALHAQREELSIVQRRQAIGNISNIVRDIVREAMWITDFEYTESLLEILPPGIDRFVLAAHHKRAISNCIGYYKKNT